MKRCPECDSSFPDTDQFCELDGTTLVPNYSDNNPDLSVPPADRKTLIILAVAGVAIGVVLFVVYERMTRETPAVSPNQPQSNQVVTQQQLPLLPLYSSPSVSASPAPEPSPSQNATPSPVVEAESARVALSSSPLSTGGDQRTKRAQFTIRLRNGTAVEADEVWETGEGIWYRRRGIVTLLERSQVKAIEKSSSASPPTSSPTVAPPSSPNASP